MEPKKLEALLKSVSAGTCSVQEAAAALSELPYADLGFAKVDHHRALRCGFAEVVFGAGKSVAETVAIVERARRHAPVVLATRVNDAQAKALSKKFKSAVHNARARTVRVGTPEAMPGTGFAALVSAGTSDGPVAEEAHETLLAFGARVRTCYDAGVAGIHRLLKNLPELREASVVIAVAGMEGALPSVAVPTRVGYGASYNGLAALLGMLNTCASGVTVVNIDNGFGAAAAALRILRQIEEDRAKKHAKKR
ncbi:MAG: nickel pincer cofactor biosynthesis protein LarB [Planctomycetes bacterium]|nr:nickel pincer cofactor biosynthesis protein LarB [Planctomycetota bacterium]